MKKALAILGALLVVALGFLMPHIAAAYQDRSLEGDVWEKENAAVSIELVRDLTDLPELDTAQSLDLFSLVASAVELEEGFHLDAVDAARAVGVLQVILPADVFLEENSFGMELLPDEVVPYLLSDVYGRSGVYWRCGWEGHPNDAVWVDDQNCKIVGFCLHVSDFPFIPLNTEMGSLVSMSLYPEGGVPQVIWADQDSMTFIVTLDDDAVTLTLRREGSYYFFNIMPDSLFDLDTGDASASGEASGEASPEGGQTSF